MDKDNCSSKEIYNLEGGNRKLVLINGVVKAVAPKESICGHIVWSYKPEGPNDRNLFGRPKALCSWAQDVLDKYNATREVA